jgi:hypothetical protein
VSSFVHVCNHTFNFMPNPLSSHRGSQFALSSSLPAALFDPKSGQSDSPHDCAFQRAFNTDLSFWEYLEIPERFSRPDCGTFEQANFNMAMVGGGRALGPPLLVGPFLRLRGEIIDLLISC